MEIRPTPPGPAPGQSSPTAPTAPTPPETTGEPVIPGTLPLLPIRNLVLFPGAVAPMSIGRPGSIRLLEESLSKTKVVGIVAQRDPAQEDPDTRGLHRVGTAALVLKLVRQSEESVLLVVHGLNRFAIRRVTQERPYALAEVDVLASQPLPAATREWEATVRNLRESATRLVQLTPDAPDEIRLAILNIDDPGNLADFLAGVVNMELAQRQEILEALDVPRRVRLLQQRINAQLEILQIQQKLQQDVTSKFSDLQRRAYLREQIQAIRKELGEGEEEGVGRQAEQLRERLQEAGPPEEVMAAAERELRRLEYVPPASAEFSVIVSYLETLAELPWTKLSHDNLDLRQARRILDRDHFDLEKVKRRLIEYLAVRRLNPAGRGPILCFLGPPGVGKTSLGQSIADALGRRFARLSLGGMRDEAEIRGHRRTYIGSMPGRLIQELRRCGTRNPVFMLDEIDKLGMDFRGDPASALLEVLDPAQNRAFVDHYLDVPFDLSQVIFITTANYLDPVPPALRDRLETIEIPGYTGREKLAIARNYLVKRQLRENGLRPAQCRWTSAALARVAEDYTREAGVRELERQIAAVCRAVAAEIAEGKRRRVHVTPEYVQSSLGPAKYVRELRLKTGQPGVVTGLAYTPEGGEVLHIEATRYPGRGNLTLTGQIGDVMEESALAALSLLRSRARALGITPEVFKNADIHIHVPSGAIPKDGPSAGVAMFTALASLFAGLPVRPTVAMTGEITLRGLVLPVGGLKEKSLAALRAGLRHVILPKLNEKDLPDIPAEARKRIRFTLVENVDEVLAGALTRMPAPLPAPTPTRPARPPAAPRSPVQRRNRPRTLRTRNRQTALK